MADATGSLTVVSTAGRKTYTWNGEVADKEAARAAFNGAMENGYFLATVVDSPGKLTQVGSFNEVLDVEKERGFVTAQITPSLQGG